jgi:peptidoglycan/xylan/chitin deacetylase (PgdA/CDA1 family)
MLSEEVVPPVLMYHSVTPQPNGSEPYTVSTKSFERQMYWIHQRNYKGMSLKEILKTPRRSTPRRSVALTFDDGYADFIEHAMPILRHYGFSATVFAIAGQLGSENNWAVGPRKALMNASQLKQIAAEGVEIGSHALHHVRLTSLTDEALHEDLVASRSILQDISQQDVRGFCYPYGDHDGRVIRAVQDAGFDYSCAVGYSHFTGRYALPRINIEDGDSPSQLWTKAALYWLRWEYRGPGSRILAAASTARATRSLAAASKD